jgi:xanthine dehydrogenase/oxidase
MSNEVSFYLNGKAVTVKDPSPDLLLIDYLRSPVVGLAGPKKACGQGGCGACTVILSTWNESGNKPEHRAINSCLRPVCALGGLVVTTIEGTGAARRPNPEFLHHTLTSSRSAAPPNAAVPAALVRAEHLAEQKRAEVHSAVLRSASKHVPGVKDLTAPTPASHPSEESHEGMNPVAHRLALNNGSQCGYCSVGFVMNMSEFIVNNPKATKREIEDIFDGNICRCTGYRPILTGMKTFASDWSKADEKNRMKCIEDDGCAAQFPADVVIPFPIAARAPAKPVTASSGAKIWETPTTLDELGQIMQQNRGRRLRLIHGNTSYGIYKGEYEQTNLFVDIRLVPELNSAPIVESGELRVGAGITYNDLIDILAAVRKDRGQRETSRLGASQFMARRTAGRIVRNAASLAGNTMLVLKHIAAGTGEPFPSDLFTALVAIEAKIEYLELERDGTFHARISSAGELVDRILENANLVDDIVLIASRLPYGEPSEVVLAQKVAQRDVNAHSIVNATTLLKLSAGLDVEKAVLVFGGIAPFPWRARKTEAAIAGSKLSLVDASRLLQILEQEVSLEIGYWAQRMKGLPSEGFTDEFRVQLAVSFLYKALVNALVERNVPVPPEVASSGEITWGKWPVSDGTQYYSTQSFKKPVAQPYIKLTAMYQTSGQIHYTQELPVPPLTVNGAFVQSRRALANYHFVIPGDTTPVSSAELREHLSGYTDAFVDLITYEHIKNGGLNYQGMALDQPLFAEKMVNYVGQSIAVVLAATEQEAIRIAEYVTQQCVAYTLVHWEAPWNEPVIGLEQAIARGSIFPDTPKSASYVAHVWKITRPGSQFDWTRNKLPLDREIVNRVGIVDNVPCQIIESTQINGGQAHFYMETQACIAQPSDERRITIRPSTQSPMEMHQTTAMALGVQYHQVDVQVAPVGGGFGGKTEQARFVTGPVAVAAHVAKRPVRLAMPRDEDTNMIGKRHAYYGQYQIAVDRGEFRAEDKGIIRGSQTKMWGDGGAFYDCSFIVSNCIQLRADNAYRVRNFENQIDVCRTNTAPSTAFRSFGDVQGKNIIENAIDDAAFSIGMLPEDLREKNLYERGDVTPFGQALSYCYMREVWSFLKNKCRYSEKRAAVDEFNRKNKWRKRGLGMIPVKYGSGYNFLQLEQAAAIVAVNQADGSIIVHQGGVEMGQGLTTQIQQVTSYVLNVPMDLIQVEGPRTSITPNPTSSGASTGTPYNCEAVKQTCQDVRSRLMDFGYQMLKENGGEWCKDNGIDFWNYGEEGWAKSILLRKRKTLIWQNLVQLAYANRVSLICTFTAKIRGGGTPVPAMTFKPQNEQPDLPGIERDTHAPLGGGVDSFVGFTYSAACSVVELDVLTGEVKVISSDIVYDMGWSMNPAIDIGQVEGAFVQGIGYLLTEKLVFEEDGPERGRLNTVNTWRYKPPAMTTIPLEMNVHLFPRDDASVIGIPEDRNDIFSAKEVGEPPLVLANSVFFAVKAAVRASRVERKLDGLFRLDAPATVQEVRRACDVSIDDFSAADQ